MKFKAGSRTIPLANHGALINRRLSNLTKKTEIIIPRIFYRQHVRLGNYDSRREKYETISQDVPADNLMAPE
jgi:hypothetical protein